jgi:hypothetical protein
MWSGQLARSGPSSAVANGFLQRQKEAVEKKKEQKRTQIRADLEKEREALDERVQSVRDERLQSKLPPPPRLPSLSSSSRVTSCPSRI